MDNQLDIVFAMMNARLNAMEDVMAQLNPDAHKLFQQKMSENVQQLMQKFPSLIQMEEELVKKSAEINNKLSPE